MQSIVPRSCTDDTLCNGYTDAQKIALGKDPFTYCAIMRADINGDGKVGFADVLQLAFSYNTQSGSPGYNPRVDQNGDGKIGFPDLYALALQYNKSVTGCA